MFSVSTNIIFVSYCICYSRPWFSCQSIPIQAPLYKNLSVNCAFPDQQDFQANKTLSKLICAHLATAYVYMHFPLSSCLLSWRQVLDWLMLGRR